MNDSGGINGHPVQVIAEDDAGTPGTAVSDAQTLISDHVVAVADVSDVDQTFATALQQANIPVVRVLTSETPFGTNPDFYPEAQTNDSAIYAVLTTAKAGGATDLANVYSAEAAICAESVGAFQTTGKQLGIPDVYNAEVSATAPSYAGQCVAAKQQHVTSMFIGESSATYMRIANDCAQQSLSPVYVQEGAGFSPNESSAPALKNALWVEFPALPLFANGPAVQAANAALDKYFPGVRQNTTLYGQDPFMAWASGVLLEDAIKAGASRRAAPPLPRRWCRGWGCSSETRLTG